MSTEMKTKTMTVDATKPGESNWYGKTTYGPPSENDNKMDENIIYMVKPSAEKAKMRTIDSETYENITALLQTTEKEEEVK